MAWGDGGESLAALGALAFGAASPLPDRRGARGLGGAVGGRAARLSARREDFLASVAPRNSEGPVYSGEVTKFSSKVRGVPSSSTDSTYHLPVYGREVIVYLVNH